MTELLQITGLEVEFPTRRGTVTAVRDVSLTVSPGEVVGLVGESGAGKSTIGNAIVDLLDHPGRVAKGSILFQGQELRGLDEDQMRRIRGDRIGMIFQDPQTSLNPLMTIGAQLVETIEKTAGLRGAKAEARAIELLESVGITEAKARLRAYPHQFSGGMRQRVVIALALAGDPDLIIADEPTTALDVSIQAQILDLIKALCRERQVGVIIVTHDIGVIANVADRVCVMYRGRVVETGDVATDPGRPAARVHPLADRRRAARGREAGALHLGRLHRGRREPCPPHRHPDPLAGRGAKAGDDADRHQGREPEPRLHAAEGDPGPGTAGCCRRWTMHRSLCSAERPSGWWANPGQASRPWPA